MSPFSLRASFDRRRSSGGGGNGERQPRTTIERWGQPINRWTPEGDERPGPASAAPASPQLTHMLSGGGGSAAHRKGVLKDAEGAHQEPWGHIMQYPHGAIPQNYATSQWLDHAASRLAENSQNELQLGQQPENEEVVDDLDEDEEDTADATCGFGRSLVRLFRLIFGSWTSFVMCFVVGVGMLVRCIVHWNGGDPAPWLGYLIMMGIFIGVMDGILLLRGLWLGIVRQFFSEQRVIPVLTDIVDPEIGNLLWTSLCLLAHELMMENAEDGGGRRLKFMRGTGDPPELLFDATDERVTRALLIFITFWAIRDVFVKFVMFSLMLGFLMNFNTEVVQFLYRYSQIRRLNAAWIRLVPSDSSLPPNDLSTGEEMARLMSRVRENSKMGGTAAGLPELAEERMRRETSKQRLRLAAALTRSASKLQSPSRADSKQLDPIDGGARASDAGNERRLSIISSPSSADGARNHSFVRVTVNDGGGDDAAAAGNGFLAPGGAQGPRASASDAGFGQAASRQQRLLERLDFTGKERKKRARQYHVETTGRCLPKPLEKRSIVACHKSKFANLLAITWLRQHPVVLFNNGTRYELQSKSDARAFGSELFETLLQFRQACVDLDLEAPGDQSRNMSRFDDPPPADRAEGGGGAPAPAATGGSAPAAALQPATAPPPQDRSPSSSSAAGHSSSSASAVAHLELPAAQDVCTPEPSVPIPPPAPQPALAVNGTRLSVRVSGDSHAGGGSLEDAASSGAGLSVSDAPLAGESAAGSMTGSPVLGPSASGSRATAPLRDETVTSDYEGSDDIVLVEKQLPENRLESPGEHRASRPSDAELERAVRKGGAGAMTVSGGHLGPPPTESGNIPSARSVPDLGWRAAAEPAAAEYYGAGAAGASGAGVAQREPAPPQSQGPRSIFRRFLKNQNQTAAVSQTPSPIAAGGGQAGYTPTVKSPASTLRHISGAGTSGAAPSFALRAGQGRAPTEAQLAAITAAEIRKVKVQVPDDRECLTQDFFELFMPGSEARQLMEFLDPAGLGKVTSKMVIKGIIQAYKLRKQILHSLEAQEQIERVFRRVCMFVLTFILLLLFLLTLGVNANALTVTGVSVLSAAAVVLSFVYTDFVQSIILLVFLNPYRIGDRVRIDGEAQYVKKITTYFTEFESLHGKPQYIAHKELIGKMIINESRCKNATSEFEFLFSERTTPSQYAAFKKVLEAYLKSRPQEFIGDSLFVFIAGVAPSHYVSVSVWATHTESWGNWMAVRTNESSFLHFILRQAQVLGMYYKLPVQRWEYIPNNGLALQASPQNAPTVSAMSAYGRTPQNLGGGSYYPGPETTTANRRTPVTFEAAGRHEAPMPSSYFSREGHYEAGYGHGGAFASQRHAEYSSIPPERLQACQEALATTYFPRKGRGFARGGVDFSPDAAGIDHDLSAVEKFRGD